MTVLEEEDEERSRKRRSDDLITACATSRTIDEAMTFVLVSSSDGEAEAVFVARIIP